MKKKTENMEKEEKKEKEKRTLIEVLKSRVTNKKVSIYSYVGKEFTEFKNSWSIRNLEEFNKRVEDLNSTREPEEIIPLLPEKLSICVYPVGPAGEYEVYFHEKSRFRSDDIKYRRIYRMINFYLHDEELVKRAEDILTPKDEDIDLYPIEVIEREEWP